MVDYTIENVIVTTEVNANLNFKSVASSLENVEYDPTVFPGIVIKLDNPKTATFLLKNGRMVCSGGRSFKESRQALETVARKLKGAGIELNEELDIDIRNIIVSVDLKPRLRLEEVAEGFSWKNIKYEPDVFEGLVYQTELESVEILLFDSGKLVCQGARKLSEINKVLDKFINRIHSVGLI